MIVDKQVILAGAQFGVDARTRTVPVAQESVITGGEPSSAISVSGTGAVVDGFQVSGNTASAGMYTLASGSRYRIRNTIFTDNVFGLYLNTGAGEDTVVFHNRFEANNRPGGVSGTSIYADSGSQNIRIEENRFTGNNGATVNFAGGSLQNEVQDQIAISRNQFIGENSMVLVGADDVTVNDNLFDGGGFDAVSVSGGSSDVVIAGNTIRGKARDGVRVRDPFGGGTNRGVRVIGNSITGSGQAGIHVLPGAMLGSLVASGNRIAGNAGAGVVNEDSDPLTAENNWWGCNTGPNTTGCDATSTPGVGGPIDGNPWLVLGAGAAPGSIGTGGQLADVTASLRTNSDAVTLAADAPFPAVAVGFTTTLGTIPASATTVGAEAHAHLTSGAVTGTATVTATLDNAAVTTPVAIVSQAGPPGPTGPAWSDRSDRRHRRCRTCRRNRRHRCDRPTGSGRAIDGHAERRCDDGPDRHLLPPARCADVHARRRVHHRALRRFDRPVVLGAAAPAPRKLAAGLAARPGVVPRARWPLTEDRGAARRQRAEPRALTRADRLDRLRHARGRRGNDPDGGEHADQRRDPRARELTLPPHARMARMSAYTITNMLELDDAAAGRAGGIEARFARSQIESEHIGVTHMRYAPDTRSPMAHSHREQEEVYIVVSGSGKAKLDDETVDLKTWDIVRVAPTTVRAFHSGPDGIELLAIGSDRPEGGDGVPGPDDFWAD